MKKLYIISLLACVFGFYSCSDDETSIPAPSEIANIKAVPGAGSVTLYWDLPADTNLMYVKVSYVNPDSKEQVVKLVSHHSDSLVIDNLLKRYGDITYTLQTFNEKETPGDAYTIVAQADAAEKTIVSTPYGVDLTIDNLFANAQEYQEGALEKLFDGLVATTNFFHSSWSGYCKDKKGGFFLNPGEPHYLVVDLGKEVYGCNFSYATRNAGDVPKNLDVYGSISFDYSNWLSSDPTGATWGSIDNVDYSPESEDAIEIANLSNMVSAATTWYNSANFISEKPFRYLWLKHTGRAYFALSELKVNTLEVSVYDPETGETTTL
ncbi:MAG: DUF4959 domain-containing protein [Oscillibacter sp.]|nr:DUF4959 domain-containing protein [Oscillibacter sp.]